ncbi:bifunctional 4-hydroxy-2-oxoglutarate aldolase/2-dehydro-3-deoxy-phosphogluconate aldolase [Garciella nitratireducens]|uniref:bifunctional 4-hydroxy-2-oxoglutarate aldolase/2-dehydro-3-deoxy-phosphogluconate aldolase n=1 Tax=Garciella nitratireducens TaxID=218205 RepID=UPI001BD56962|nr:bifunctional 4-hydroxy-2-oxoglutarate aldolase/2-dehydro-3-deoxy-phosphogluconate aldolase [Garciella nitratireducens]
MKDYEVLQKINEYGICAIVRGISSDKMCNIAEALLKGGVKIVEVTFNTFGAAQMIQELVEKYGNNMLVGAGTVLDPETAKIAISSGAQFILSPTLNLNVIKMCQRYSVLPIPGITTPTEALTAWENGVQIVKVFPAGVLGSNYIKQLKGPLGQINMMAVGAINTSNVSDFIKAGANSAGIGGGLVDNKLVKEGKFDEIKQRARIFVEAFQNAKNNV